MNHFSHFLFIFIHFFVWYFFRFFIVFLLTIFLFRQSIFHLIFRVARLWFFYFRFSFSFHHVHMVGIDIFHKFHSHFHSFRSSIVSRYRLLKIHFSSSVWINFQLESIDNWVPLNSEVFYGEITKITRIFPPRLSTF